MKKSKRKLCPPGQAQPSSWAKPLAVVLGVLAGAINAALAGWSWRNLGDVGEPLVWSRRVMEGYLGTITVMSIVGIVGSLWMANSIQRGAMVVLITAGVAVIASVSMTILGVFTTLYFMPCSIVQLATAGLALSTIGPSRARDVNHS